MEVVEEQREDEDVIHTQRDLDEVAGEELQRRLLPRRRTVVRADPAEMDAEAQEEREAHPHAGPDQRLAQLHLVRLAVKEAEIQREHREDEADKSSPPESLGCHDRKMS